LKKEALRLGFRYVEAGPLVRSSYHAGRHASSAEAIDYGNDPIFKRYEAAPMVKLVQIEGRKNAEG
jgi:hypothetical protein